MSIQLSQWSHSGRSLQFSLARLSATVAYLRFPLRAEHRGRLCDGSVCPRCQHTRIQKWGRFAGRQRYRCRGCRRTFSTFTGTPLRYLKRPERWRAFLWCMEGRLTLRRSGSLVGIDKNTALRWRHRVLDHWLLEPHRRLRGSIAVGEFWMPRNEKGRRGRGRGPRRRGQVRGRSMDVLERVGLVAATEKDSDGGAELWIGRTGVPMLRGSDYPMLLGPRLGHVTEIIGGRGPLCALAGFAASVGAAYRSECPGYRRGNVPQLRLELRAWMRPLRGVASHRLDNYLEWFRRDRALPIAPGGGRDGDPTNSSRIQSHRGEPPGRPGPGLRPALESSPSPHPGPDRTR